MKRILSLFFLFIIIPTGNALAANDYQNGIFDQIGYQIVVGDSSIFDNDLTTQYVTGRINPKVEVILDNEVNITDAYLNVGYRTGSQIKGYVQYFDKHGNLVGIYITPTLHYAGYHAISANDVKSIEINFTGDFFVREFEVFGEIIPQEYETILKLNEVHDHTSVSLHWENPDVPNLKNIIIRQNGVEIATLNGNVETYKATGLLPNTKYDFSVVAKYSDNGLSDPVAISTTTNEAPNITDLRASATHNNSKITWLNPTVSDFVGVTILKDGEKVIDLGKTINNYTITNLVAETEYKYEILARFAGGFQTDRVPITFTTLKAPIDAGDVVDLTAEATHNRVDLSWILPESDKFKHVKIYRETLKSSFFDKLLGVRTVMAATPIFETNGTYFNDLTVEPDTKYEYTLTTFSNENIESDGVSIQVTTLKKPVPEIIGGEFDKDPDTGDFTYTWSQPITGKVRVIIGNKVYATVPASDGQIVIPSAEMKYTIFGKPDVRLVPVDEDGTEGKPVKPPSVGDGGSSGGIGNIEKLPFDVLDLVKTSFSVLGLLSGIILLVLSIDLVPRLIRFIKNSAAGKEVTR